jgi:hypothetical protein
VDNLGDDLDDLLDLGDDLGDDLDDLLDDLGDLLDDLDDLLDDLGDLLDNLDDLLDDFDDDCKTYSILIFSKCLIISGFIFLLYILTGLFIPVLRSNINFSKSMFTIGSIEVELKSDSIITISFKFVKYLNDSAFKIRELYTRIFRNNDNFLINLTSNSLI